MEVLEEHIKLPFETVKEFNSYILQREKEVLFTQRNAYNKAFVSSQAKTLKTLKKTGG